MIGILKPRKEIIGQVFSGVIEEIGEKTNNFRVGDKVYGLSGFSLGAYAEYKKIREINSKQGCVALMPDNISFEEATSVAYGGLLAQQFLEKKTINAGDRVLIYGSSSISGVFATQYLKNLGAEITCVCRENKFEFMRTLGAHKLLDYTDKKSINKLEQYDLVFDCVGKARNSELKMACKNHLHDKTNFISIDDEALLLDSSRLLRINELVQKNIIKPVNDRIYSFEQMIEAHKYVETGHKRGNVAVTVNKTEVLGFSPVKDQE